VPPRPPDFEDYPSAVAAYLSKAGSAAAERCLAGLLEAWTMPEPDAPLAAEERCRAGNTDADADDELAVLFTATPEDPGLFGLLSNVAVFDLDGDAYRVVYQSWTADQFPEVFPHSIAAAGDVNADGNGELVYTRSTCGAHTCTLSVFVITGDGAGYRHLTPFTDDPAAPSGIAMETAELTLEDRDGDGAQEIVLHGGIIGSAGAGPQRTRTEVYAWNGEVYALTELTYDTSDLRYFAVLDADAAFGERDYERAAQLYEEALGDGLAEVEGFGSRDELLAYAEFRLGLSRLVLDDFTGASQAIEVAIARYPATMTADAAIAFRNAMNLSEAGYAGDLAAGCAAATGALENDAARFEEAWSYGYANPQLTPAAVCPF
jgi:hypothetical protein